MNSAIFPDITETQASEPHKYLDSNSDEQNPEIDVNNHFRFKNATLFLKCNLNVFSLPSISQEKNDELKIRQSIGSGSKLSPVKALDHLNKTSNDSLVPFGKGKHLLTMGDTVKSGFLKNSRNSVGMTQAHHATTSSGFKPFSTK